MAMGRYRVIDLVLGWTNVGAALACLYLMVLDGFSWTLLGITLLNWSSASLLLTPPPP